MLKQVKLRLTKNSRAKMVLGRASELDHKGPISTVDGVDRVVGVVGVVGGRKLTVPPQKKVDQHSW